MWTSASSAQTVKNLKKVFFVILPSQAQVSQGETNYATSPYMIYTVCPKELDTYMGSRMLL